MYIIVCLSVRLGLLGLENSLKRFVVLLCKWQSHWQNPLKSNEHRISCSIDIKAEALCCPMVFPSLL